MSIKGESDFWKSGFEKPSIQPITKVYYRALLRSPCGDSLTKIHLYSEGFTWCEVSEVDERMRSKIIPAMLESLNIEILPWHTYLIVEWYSKHSQTQVSMQCVKKGPAKPLPEPDMGSSTYTELGEIYRRKE